MSTARIDWIPPTQRVNSDPLPLSSIAGYDIYDTVPGAALGADSVTAKIGTIGAPPFTAQALAAGEHIFSVVVKTTTGAFSDPTTASPVEIPVPAESPPMPVTGLTVTVLP